jgi:pimeloyl-ACP methyl ester carboxylesterase
MNADIRRSSEIEPYRLRVPEVALGRLRLRLGRGTTTGETLAASLAYHAPFDELCELVDYWCTDFELERQALLELPCFSSQIAERDVCFVHARSRESFAMPLLLLHGYSGSLAEFESIIEPLTAGGAKAAFHVVCPSLPGFGLSRGAPHVRALAEANAELMARLGYTRYLVHGSDLGANIALELAAVDSAHVAGLHVTALPAFPGETPEELASLTRTEKSQLALLTEFHERLAFQLPRSPIEQLAFALVGLDDSAAAGPKTAWRDSLLTGLTLAWTGGSSSFRNRLYRDSRLARAPASGVPVAVHSYPLDAPSLRRFAERQHRVVEWIEHVSGGCLPALEQPEQLVESLRAFFAGFL